MTDRSKTLEVMRDGIAKVYGGVISPDGLNMIADLALTAYESRLHAEGMAVVPVEPTEAMLDHGGTSIIRPSIYMGGTPPGAKRRARDVWAAMLAASPYGKAVVKEASAEAQSAVAHPLPHSKE